MTTPSSFDARSSPLFKQLLILKLNDLAYVHTALFMRQYHYRQLPLTFDSLFETIVSKHKYNTRLASKLNYYLPKARTNFGKFNIRFTGVKIWTSIALADKQLNKIAFKKKLIADKICTY